MAMSIRDQEALKQAIADIKSLQAQVAWLKGVVEGLMPKRPLINVPQKRSNTESAAL